MNPKCLIILFLLVFKWLIWFILCSHTFLEYYDRWLRYPRGLLQIGSANIQSDKLSWESKWLLFFNMFVQTTVFDS